jgi:hypothetical protein
MNTLFTAFLLYALTTLGRAVRRAPWGNDEVSTVLRGSQGDAMDSRQSKPAGRRCCPIADAYMGVANTFTASERRGALEADSLPGAWVGERE